MDSDGAGVLTAVMRSYPDHVGILKQSCCVVRNIAGRCPDYHSALKDAGLESLIKHAGVRHRTIVDEAYAALRDLRCDVKMVAVDPTGRVSSAFDSFSEDDDPSGQGKRRLNFNPVFEESTDVAQSIQARSQAPFASVR
jgi:hypothetical protein